MKTRGARVYLVVSICLIFAAVPAFTTGCGDSDEVVSEEGWEYITQDSGDDFGEDVRENNLKGGEGVVHMCGRSVLGGWFEYWGWDWDYEQPEHFEGYELYYHEMEVPPDIVYSAEEVAAELAGLGGGCMFFKLCFDDFEGGDEYTARENLERNEEIVQSVVDFAVDEMGLTLILGNALPVVEEYCDRWMVWNQREYNSFLEGLSREYGDKVVVLDLYGTLADGEGCLRSEYAADEYDSHLNASAYSALNEKLEETLDNLLAAP
ncbi:MAG: SGNH/GDSL hydrolase family protein [Actinomycetota bacterium]|nr:SGNH/GDSL hydrolase family protein [Actinomycetota bacterium]